MNYLVLYLLGTLIVAGSLGYGAHLLGVPLEWICVVMALVLGMGIMAGAKRMRRNTGAGGR